jgi:AcrR family transcriptional regulator
VKPARGVRQRRRPHQLRSARRVRQILDLTARLLEREGPNRLTTNLVARELGVSVGTLYHYFPNKHSILHVLGANWLDAWQRSFDAVAALTTQHTTVVEFVDLAVENMLPVYRSQHGIQHLVLAMFTIPELRALDEHSDELAIRRLALTFRRLRVPGSAAERQRLARLYLKISNTLLLEAIRQRGSAARRTLADLKMLLVHMLRG